MSNASDGYQFSHRKKLETRSWDRVHFKLPAHYLLKRTIRDCVEETLGISRNKMLTMGERDQDLNIICRPSQFARFVILRHVKYGEQNNMSCLNMRLILPEDKKEDVIDVSGNPNTSGGAEPS